MILHEVLPQDLFTISSPTFRTFYDGFKAPNGFEDRTESTITYVAGTRTVSVTPGGSNFSVWRDGDRYDVASISEQHGTASGGWFLYYDASNSYTLTFDQNAWDVINDIPVAYVYWDNANSQGICFDERHGSERNPQAHYHQHFTTGTYWNTTDGLAVVINGNTFSLATGTTHDEDIAFAHAAKNDNEHVVFWKTGSSSLWTWDATVTDPWYDTGGNVHYNYDSGGGNWTTGAIDNGKYVCYYVVAAPDVAGGTRSFLVMGQNQYNTVALARAESFSDMDTGGFPFQEVLACYKIILSHTGVIQDDPPEDLRLSTSRALISSTPGSSHNSLSGLQGGVASEYYHLDATEFGHLDGQDQGVSAADSPTFAALTLTSQLTVGNGGTGLNTLTQFGMLYAPTSSTLAVIPDLRYNPTKSITTASNAAPVVITSTAHGFEDGDIVEITGVTGSTTANGVWEVANKTANTFELRDSQAGGAGTGGTIYAVLQSEQQFTAKNLMLSCASYPVSLRDFNNQLGFGSDRNASFVLRMYNGKERASGTADGTTAINFYGVGYPGSNANRERLEIGFLAASNLAYLASTAAGTGTVRQLNIYTGANTTQLYCDTSGNVFCNTGNFSVPTGYITCSGGYRVTGSTGVSGSFTTTDGKTVTVTQGIITAIV
jgi:hypothetical protein